MSMRDGHRRSGLLAGAALLLLFGGTALAQPAPPRALAWSTAGEETPKLGILAAPDEIAAYDIDAEPDGAGLPPGGGTALQGAAIYAAQCQNCHGEKGVHGGSPALAGGFGTIGKGDHVKPVKTVGSFWPYATSVFAYIRRAMPYYDSKSLNPDQLYALTAYVLQINGLIGEADVMNAETLPRVQMPNRDGFYRWSRGD